VRWNLLLAAFLMLVFGACKQTRPVDEFKGDRGGPRQPSVPAETTPRASPAAVDVLSSAAGHDHVPAGPESSDLVDEKGALKAVPPLSALTWSITPGQLDVMRSTEVKMMAHWEGVAEGDYECSWDPGDRTGRRRGCDVKHTFATGLVDRKVTLEVSFNGQSVFTESRPLPLERLRVKELPGSGPTKLPDRDASKSVRVLLWSVFAAPKQADIAALRKALEVSKASHAILFFNMQVNGTAMRGLVDSLEEESGVTFLPLFCGGLEGEGGWTLPKSFVAHGSSNEVPFRHALMAGGIGYVVLDTRARGNDLAQEKWLLDRLQEMRVASHRVGLSCRPIESLTGEATELTPQFRYYEKLLRGDVSALISAGDPVFYHGAYGDLSAVSAGCAVGSPGTLAGTDVAQSTTIGILDLAPGKKATAWSLSAKDPSTLIGSSTYPRQVGNYERKL
jgi:hypothetical protein